MPCPLMRTSRVTALLLPLLACSGPRPREWKHPDEIPLESWREDLDTLARKLPRRHVRPFGKVPRERFEAAVAGLRSRLPRLARHEKVVAFQRLVALLGDAHTTISAGDVAADFRAFPFACSPLKDGVLVEPTVADVRAGRDAILEAAVAYATPPGP